MTPEFELWIKASQIDKVSKGACPLCQQWYMVAYILAENKLASFKVITVSESSPPKVLREKSSSGLFPVIVGVAGETESGSSVEGLVADESCELEQFFQMFKCPLLKMDGSEQISALAIFLDLNTIFNRFLSTGNTKRLNDIMNHLNEHLKEKNTKYMIGDELTYVDCVLLPRLQHVRVAGNVLKNYDIPHNLVYLWRYLENGYKAEAFFNTCPTDPVIINHYQKKISVRGGMEASLMKETTTISIPKDILASVAEPMTTEISVENGNGIADSNGEADEVQTIESEEVKTSEITVESVEDTEVASDPDPLYINNNNNGDNPID
ncbi:chloride intracellular channel exc-4-like [Argonauta hians]